MATTATKQKLSGSTSGKGILVAATSSPGTTIHAAASTSDASDFDEVWLWASNTDTTARKLTIEYGGTSAGFIVELTIPAESGPVLVIPGWLATDGISIAAFCATTNVVNIHGYVNRITNG